jgi:hypothetical protein
MPRAAPIQTNFTAGELSPRLKGRVDLSKYYNGVQTLENMVIHPHGGASRRSGTRYVAEVKTSSKKVRLVPFEFSTIQAYILEFGDLYIRIYKDEGRIESPPGTPVEVTTPYTESDLAGIKFAQSADTMYLVHPSHAPRKLTRTSHTSWTLTVVDFIKGPFLAENEGGGKELTPSAVSGNITITATGHSPFAATDINRLVYIRHTGSWPSGGYARITSFISSTQVNATVKENFQVDSAATTWRLGSWSGTTGWPESVAFYEERLFFGGNSNQPQTLWGSMTGDFENFTEGTLDSNAVTFTIATDRVNAIRWLSPGRVLVLGTIGGEFIMQAGAQDEVITPTNINIRRHTNRGCANVLPVRIGHVVLYLQRAARKLRELVFDFQSDGFVAPDLTLLAEHVSEGGIIEMAYAQEPDSVLWCARADGTLLGMTYERDQEVVGWHRHILGGSFASGQAAVESIAVIPSPNEDHDQLWLVAKRTVNGVTKRYIEFMEEAFPSDGAQTDAFFVDSGLTYNGAAATTISGLDHLEGESVQILADGAVHPDKTVLSGQITLEKAASVAHIGCGFVSRVQTLPFEAGSADGTAQGKTKRVHEAIIRFWNTVGAKVGPDTNTLDVVPFRGGSDAMGAPPALFTGDKRVKFPAGYEKVARVMVFQEQPLPMTVLAVMPRLVTYDD